MLIQFCKEILSNVTHFHIRVCWHSVFKLCIAGHGNFQGHGNFHGYQLWVLHGIFHGPWKFPWGSLSQIPRPWKFPWGREISMRVLITPQTGGVPAINHVYSDQIFSEQLVQPKCSKMPQKKQTTTNMIIYTPPTVIQPS